MRYINYYSVDGQNNLTNKNQLVYEQFLVLVTIHLVYFYLHRVRNIREQSVKKLCL